MTQTRALLDKLTELGATLNEAPLKSNVEAVERRLNCRFPQGILDFYSVCDGLSDATSESRWDFFSLDNVVERTLWRRESDWLSLWHEERIAYGDLIEFCDVFIDAPSYLFCGNPTNACFGKFYADNGGKSGWKVADNYDDFVSLFLIKHDENLLFPDSN